MIEMCTIFSFCQLFMQSCSSKKCGTEMHRPVTLYASNDENACWEHMLKFKLRMNIKKTCWEHTSWERMRTHVRKACWECMLSTHTACQEHKLNWWDMTLLMLQWHLMVISNNNNSSQVEFKYWKSRCSIHMQLCLQPRIDIEYETQPHPSSETASCYSAVTCYVEHS